MAPIAENLATAALLVLSLALTIIAWRAYRHTGSRRVLLLTAGFALFVAKGLILTIGLFAVPDWGARLLLASVLFDLVILAAFYGAVLRRSPA